MLDASLVRETSARSRSRHDLWTSLLDAANIKTMAEIGVYRGQFAEEMLRQCPQLERYYLIDPWRHLAAWNKPANRDDERFARFLEETKQRTEFAAERRVILRGRTTEVIDQIPDGSLDAVYIDGDHTLRGISIDLIRCYEKVRPGGWIGGDDFTKTVWQHSSKFEPTLVFPFAVYFAEAMGTRIYALHHAQFLIEKGGTGFELVDLTNSYPPPTLQAQLHPDRVLRRRVAELMWPRPLVKRARGYASRIAKMVREI